MERMEKLLKESEENTTTSSQEDEDDNSVLEDLTSSSEEEDEDSIVDEESGTFYIFKEENPYKIVETDEENGVYQVIGNEIILLARADGVCCLCSEIQKILFVDNSYGGNIPAQICLPCVKKVLKE